MTPLPGTMFFDGNINTMAKLALQDLDLIVLAVRSAATSAVVWAYFYVTLVSLLLRFNSCLNVSGVSLSLRGDLFPCW